MEFKTGKTRIEPESPGVRVPPDRRRTKRRKPGQKPQRGVSRTGRLLATLKVLASVSGIALAILGGLFALRFVRNTDLLTLRNISIEGCRHSDPGSLESILRRDFSGNILQIDLDRVRARMEEQTWVRLAEVRRVLPYSLKIFVQERVPSVVAEIGSSLYLLDNEGVLLDPYGPEYGKLDVPILRGLSGDSAETYQALQKENSERVRLAVQVLGDLRSGASDYTRAISEVDLSDPRNVRVLLVDDTAEIRLGNRDFLTRFQSLMTNISDYEKFKSAYGECSSVDLRYEGKIIYHPRQPLAEKIEVGGVIRQ